MARVWSDMHREWGEWVSSSGGALVTSTSSALLVPGNGARARLVATVFPLSASDPETAIELHAGHAQGPVIGTLHMQRATQVLRLEDVGDLLLMEIYARANVGTLVCSAYSVLWRGEREPR